MLNIAVCDDSRTDVEMLESAFDKLAQYQFSYEVYFTAKELLKHVIDYGEMYVTTNTISNNKRKSIEVCC